ncbi:MAG TPA: hypothetical protein VF461_16580 [Gemmatimonadaceae bacterium]
MPQTARRLVPALVLVTALAACGKKEGAATSESAAPNAAAPASTPAASAKDNAELADVQSYKLSMDKIDKMLAAQRIIAAKAKAMTPAEREAMQARGESASDADESLDAMARKFDSEPIMRDAIREAGLSSREYVLITMSMMQSGMADGVLKMRPKDNQDSLIREMKANPDNVKFYREHQAEITAKTKAIEAEMKAVSGN